MWLAELFWLLYGTLKYRKIYLGNCWSTRSSWYNLPLSVSLCTSVLPPLANIPLGVAIVHVRTPLHSLPSRFVSRSLRILTTQSAAVRMCSTIRCWCRVGYSGVVLSVCHSTIRYAIRVLWDQSLCTPQEANFNVPVEIV